MQILANMTLFSVRSEINPSTRKIRVWSIQETKVTMRATTCRLFPFCHVLTGCDTTSILLRIGNGSAVTEH